MIPASGKVRLGASGVLLFLLCAPGCRSRALAPQEYMAWVRNPRNGLRTEKAIGELRPDAYIINEDAFNIPFRKEWMKKYDGVELIILPRYAPPGFGDISTSGIIKKIKSLS